MQNHLHCGSLNPYSRNPEAYCACSFPFGRKSARGPITPLRMLQSITLAILFSSPIMLFKWTRPLSFCQQMKIHQQKIFGAEHTGLRCSKLFRCLGTPSDFLPIGKWVGCISKLFKWTLHVTNSAMNYR